MKSIVFFALIGGVIATLNRLLHIANYPENLTRYDDGRINWKWCLFNNTVRIAVAMCVSVFVGVVVLPHITIIDETSRYAIAGASAIMGEQLWNIIGKKIKEFVEKWIDDSAKDERSRRGRR